MSSAIACASVSAARAVSSALHSRAAEAAVGARYCSSTRRLPADRHARFPPVGLSGTGQAGRRRAFTEIRGDARGELQGIEQELGVA